MKVQFHGSIKFLATASIAFALGNGSAAAQDSMPTGSVAYFDTTAGCPDGWKLFTDADGHFLLPKPWNGNAGQNAGVSIDYRATDGRQFPTHTHSDASASIDVDSRDFAVIPGGPNKHMGHSGEYVVTLQAPVVGQSGLPYVQYTVCEKTTDSDGGTVPRDLMSFFNGNACPSDEWEEVEHAAGRYIVALPTNGHPAASFGGLPMEPDEIRTHHHDFNGSIYFKGASVSAAPGCCGKGYAAQGRTYFSGTTEPAPDVLPTDSAVQAPYYTASFCAKR